MPIMGLKLKSCFQANFGIFSVKEENTECPKAYRTNINSKSQYVYVLPVFCLHQEIVALFVFLLFKKIA